MEGTRNHQEAERAQQGEAKGRQAMAGETGLFAGTLKPLKCVNRPHNEVTIPSGMHQYDLFCMPIDLLYRNEFKYILSRIDIASRYKVARPMRMTQAKDVTDDCRHLQGGPSHLSQGILV